MSEAVSFNPSRAVGADRFRGSARQKVVRAAERKVRQGQGWHPLYAAIASWFFGECDPPPSQERFAQLVAGWQRERAGIALNGIASMAPRRRMLQQAPQGVLPDYSSPLTCLVKPHC